MKSINQAAKADKTFSTIHHNYQRVNTLVAIGQAALRANDRRFT